VRLAVVGVTLSLIVVLFIEDGGGDFEARQSGLRQINHAENSLYNQECGSCHLAYPAGLLPERSWVKMMMSLDDHFGENAELDPKTNKDITNYLINNSAERGSRRSIKILDSIPPSESPLRFTETNFFKMKHHEISDDIFKHRSVLSKANCQSCHLEAQQARFSVLDVRIPD
jgi:hypothetical protein